MFKRIDWYIIGNYLRTFGFTVLIFTMISAVVDFSEKVQKFIVNDVGWTDVITGYYLWYIPYINAQLIPLYALISVIFFTSRLADNSEILSMLNAGMSLRRITWPYLFAAGLIACLSLALNHVVVPYGNQYRLAFERDRLGREKDLGRNSDVHMFIAPGKKIYVRHYAKSDSVARDFRLESYDGPKLLSVLTAARAEWRGRDSTWRLYNHSYRTFDELHETFSADRRAPIDTTLALYPSDFVAYKYEKDQLPTARLVSYIKKERARGVGNTKAFEIEREKRTAEPFSVLILTLIGLAIAGRKTRGGLGIHLATGIALGALFVFLSRFSHTFANSNAMPALIGVWIPNLLFGIVAVILLSRAQR